MIIEEPHHIIAIGASAGGMEEINAFFDHTQLDGVSYVIVQHLSGDFKSRMVELLSKHSKLEVKEAEDGMPVKSNQVYLIPNDKFMTIRNRNLILVNKNKFRGPHLTINTFFNSLAADTGSKAIGVILSGLGADGTEGIQAIKNAGGMVIARNPDTTEFASMPSNAIATGSVDFVLEPELMPSTIEDYVKQEADKQADKIKDNQNVDAILALINDQLPLDFSDYKQSTILRRIKRRAAIHNFTKVKEYLAYLKTDQKEVETLANDFLINVTAFFRDPEAFEIIGNTVLPAIIRNLKPEDEIRFWVAGCATGEEAYSLAMLVHEQLGGKTDELVIKIFATDIDSAALTRAGKGIYNSSSLKNLSPERQTKFFLKEGDKYKVIPEIRKMVIFAKHDLVKNPPYCNMQLISCRNLLIYMTPALQKKIFSMLLFGLKLNGYLFLGSSENPLQILDSVEVVNKKWKIFNNQVTKRKSGFDAFSIPDFFEKKAKSFSFPQKDAFRSANYLTEEVNKTLVNNLDFLIICIDENNLVVKSYGDTTKYLFQRNFTLNLTDLLEDRLAVAFKTLRNKVIKTNKKASVSGIEIEKGKAAIQVNLSVSPLANSGKDQKMLLVVFSENKQGSPVSKENIMFDNKMYLDQYTQSLEEELQELKDTLRDSNEKLYATSENMQSFSEELLSANEEMQSTNEEMESVNEELHTINSEYLFKNKELLELNDDLNNYFKSNINGQLFVNQQLELMKFSPGTLKLINLQDSDLGRPINKILTNFKFQAITEDINKVIKDGSVITKEIETNDNKWYQVMTMPYIKQAGNIRNGAIVTFADITELKDTQKQLDEKNKSLMRINADLDNFVHTASHDLLSPLGSIEGSISAMNEIGVNDPELKVFLDIIDSSIKKFRSLIIDIATIAKLESNTIIMEMVDLNETINNIEWSLNDKIASSKAVIHRDLEIKEIYFSKKNLRSIVFNLISNAIKFKSDKPPVIYIKTKKVNNNTILTVEDNGIGIAEKDSEQIFKKYGRLKMDIDGQGIGLYLAKKIVDSAGGDIIVESTPGKGSKFILCFPTVQDAS